MAIAKWDVDEGERLWMEGKTAGEIAEALGVKTDAVRTYANHHWPFRKDLTARDPNGPKWDTELGRQMYEAGASYAEIGRRMDRSAAAIQGYAQRHWRGASRPAPPPTAADCKRPCWYMSTSPYGPICNYYLDTDKRRPCSCGPECTVRIPKHRPTRLDQPETVVSMRQDIRRRKKPKPPAEGARKGRPQVWDREKGLELYRQGMSCAQIARIMGVRATSISKYARKHWPPRGEK